jgi:iron complex transport system ATP-binding protein
MPMLEARNLTYQIGRKVLLRDLSLQAHTGELLAIVGANGAGKSTLLKLLSREYQPTAGHLRLRGKMLADYSDAQLARLRAVLPQHNALSLPFLARELVMMGRYPHFDAQPTEQDQMIVEASMQKAGALPLANRTYPTLSGGEQQRVQLARVLAQIWDTPHGLLLLDEPTTGLDWLHQHHLLEVARAFARKGYCVIAVLHDLNLAVQYADRILMLRQGEALAYGSARETMTEENIYLTFDLPVRVMEHPDLDCPLILPQGQALKKPFSTYSSLEKK